MTARLRDHPAYQNLSIRSLQGTAFLGAVSSVFGHKRRGERDHPLAELDALVGHAPDGIGELGPFVQSYLAAVNSVDEQACLAAVSFLAPRTLTVGYTARPFALRDTTPLPGYTRLPPC